MQILMAFLQWANAELEQNTEEGVESLQEGAKLGLILSLIYSILCDLCDLLKERCINFQKCTPLHSFPQNQDMQFLPEFKLIATWCFQGWSSIYE